VLSHSQVPAVCELHLLDSFLPAADASLFSIDASVVTLVEMAGTRLNDRRRCGIKGSPELDVDEEATAHA
jgi:hypothetical protein